MSVRYVVTLVLDVDTESADAPGRWDWDSLIGGGDVEVVESTAKRVGTVKVVTLDESEDDEEYEDDYEDDEDEEEEEEEEEEKPRKKKPAKKAKKSTTKKRRR